MTWWRWMTLGSWVMANLLVDFAFLDIQMARADTTVGLARGAFVYGWIVGQLVLIAILMALVGTRWLLRAGMAVVLLTLMWFALFAPALLESQREIYSRPLVELLHEAPEHGILMAGTVLFDACVLAAVWRKRQITPPRQLGAEVAHSQFSIGDLLVVMGLMAVLLGIGRFYAPAFEELPRMEFARAKVLAFGLHLLAIVPAIGIPFLAPKWLAPALVGWLVALAGIGALQAQQFFSPVNLAQGPYYTMVLYHAMIYWGEFASVLLTLSILRVLGFQWEPTRRSQPERVR